MNNWDNNYVDGYQSAVQAENEMTLQRYVAAVMRRVYGQMTLGLLLTALTCFLMLASETLKGLFLVNKIVLLLLFAAELGSVIYLSARINKMSATMSRVMFYLYSILNGITLTPIFYVYTSSSIAATFAITAAMFGAMTIFGYVTRQDLSKIGSFLVMALFGLIACLLVSMFWQNSMFELLISFAGVLIFVGLTAWDTQAIKRMCAEADSSMVGKVATMGALTLYLDFINLFIYLLRIFGNRN